MLGKTICAISTPYGKGGVAVIRISGDGALEIAKRVFIPRKSGELLPRVAYYGEIKRENDVIDDGILTYFKAPHSFTGEDVCEICSHGGLYVTRAVLETVLSAGAEMAEAGEFTKRAFINGRLTLSRAEAIASVIDAKTDSQLRLSSSMARGALSSRLLEIREKIIAILSRAYATIDYPDEDITDTGREEFEKTLDLVADALLKLKKSYRAGRAVAEGISCAIVGKPNAGKSSLYNLIAGKSLAIVTDIAGTTRDVIENTVELGGVTLRLADTAGIRETSDVVEKIGVDRAREKIIESELIFALFDSSEDATNEDYRLIDALLGRDVIAIINKVDKERKMPRELYEKIKTTFENCVEISANDVGAIDTLGSVLSRIYELGEINLSSDAVVASARQSSAICVAYEKVISAREALFNGETPDIVCFSLEEALSSIDMIDGRETSEEIVNEIFSRFCVGK